MSPLTPIASKKLSPPLRVKGLLQERLSELQDHLAMLNPQSDPETIHQIRVLCRRLRALCRLLRFAEAPSEFRALEKVLRRTARDLSPIRNWDVSQERLGDLEREWKKKNERGLKFLRKIFPSHITEIRKDCLTKFSAKKISKSLGAENLFLNGDRFSEQDFEGLLAERVKNSSLQVLRKWQKFQKSHSPEALHKVRTSLKKLRYSLEIQTIYFDVPGKKKLESFKHFQDQLGYLRDLQILKGHLKEKAIRKNIPSKKRNRFRRLNKFLKNSLEEDLKNFQKNQGPRLKALVEGNLP